MQVLNPKTIACFFQVYLLFIWDTRLHFAIIVSLIKLGETNPWSIVEGFKSSKLRNSVLGTFSRVNFICLLAIDFSMHTCWKSCFRDNMNSTMLLFCSKSRVSNNSMCLTFVLGCRGYKSNSERKRKITISSILME